MRLITSTSFTFLAMFMLTQISTANALDLRFGNKCSIKTYGALYEFEAFLTDGQQWIHVDEISITIRIANSGSRTFSRSNTNYINKNFKTFEVVAKFPGIVRLGWNCQDACISGFADRNGTRYSNRGFCTSGR